MNIAFHEAEHDPRNPTGRMRFRREQETAIMIRPNEIQNNPFAAIPVWPPQRHLAPVAGQLLKNFLFKTIGYFDCDYAVFVHESVRARNLVFFTIASRSRMAADAVEMARGMFLLPFFCNAPRLDLDAEIVTVEHCMNERAEAQAPVPHSPGDYRYLHLMNNDHLQGLAGIGCFDKDGMSAKSAEWNEYSQFLHCSGAALLHRL